MNIQIETITLKDGSKMDVIRDVKAVKKLMKRTEKAERVCNLFREYLNNAKKPWGPVTDALCQWMEWTAKNGKVTR